MEKLEISNEILSNLVKNLCIDLKEIFNKDVTSFNYLKKTNSNNHINIIELEIPEILKIKLNSIININNNTIINYIRVNIGIKNKTDIIFVLDLNQLNTQKKLLYKLIKLL